jgi:hypothetical protein
MSERDTRARSRRERTEPELPEEVAAEFSTEELLEFLEADHAPDTADPGFRERLREELWQLVQSRQRFRGR